VKVLPEPVTPSSVWRSKPFLSPFMSAEIAFGWSPAGVRVVANLNVGSAIAEDIHFTTYKDKEKPPDHIQIRRLDDTTIAISLHRINRPRRPDSLKWHFEALQVERRGVIAPVRFPEA